ncbi:MAG: hypothetical protein DME18_17450, partial [Verrucomicrobia bacterium]
VFPGATKLQHWSFADPSSLTGTEAEQLQRTREIREEIKKRVQAWVRDVKTWSEARRSALNR